MRISDWSSDVCSSDLFYDARRAAIQAKAPNAAHEALARLDAAWPGALLIVTQNIDDLHERAGAKRLIHMHGEHLNAWCTACAGRSPWTDPLIDRPACPAFGLSATLPPYVVWFGEMTYRLDPLYSSLAPHAPLYQQHRPEGKK